MVERFLSQTSFTSQEDFIKNLKINVPENFNFGYDVVDAWAAEHPDKPALLWTNDKGEHIQFSFADMKRYTDMTASYFQSLGIGHGDMVMLILKRRYEFWFSIIALHKLGAVVIPATHLLTKKDIVYRCNAADIKMIVCAGESVITDHITAAMPDSPSVKKLVSVGPEIAEGFEDFHKGIADAAPFARPEHPNSNDDISLMYFTSGTTGEPKMVAHDFTYPLGHIVTGSFWHNLHENSLHLTIADTVTDSMEKAVTETNRRREIQMKYNEEHGITPKTIVKDVRAVLEISSGKDKGKKRKYTKAEREALIKQYTAEMKNAAKLLDFEHAAYLRDKIKELQESK